MLRTLQIKNFALIDSLELDFNGGYTVLTGETGAGKSIVLGALNLVLGARASSESVQHGASAARIDAIFEMDSFPPPLQRRLEEHDLNSDENSLHLARVVSTEGRSKAYVNGNIVPLSVLSVIGDELVDLHGQHEHQSLLNTTRQRELLDHYGGITDQAIQHARVFKQWSDSKKQLDLLENEDRDQERHIEFLKFEFDEIVKAQLSPDEESELESRRNRITNAETIHELTGQIRQLLIESEGAAQSILGQSSRLLSELGNLAEEYEPLGARLDTLQDEMTDISQELDGLIDGVEFDPDELNSINERLVLIRDLKRKHGETIEDILNYAKNIESEIDLFEHRDEMLDELRILCSTSHDKAMKTAKAISKKRKNASKELEKRITEVLQHLGMEGARLVIDYQPQELSSYGLEQIQYLIEANAGEPLKPLKQVASGGEISRIMLALKAIFAESDAVPTLVFDEIDTGVGGVVANRIAETMAQLSISHQTICITHLPQLAAAASSHFHVSKAIHDGRTRSDVRTIQGDERVDEIARLLDGGVTEVSTEHARKLIQELSSANS
jgi:DNA repair protein RecN (Recombination protein N)